MRMCFRIGVAVFLAAALAMAASTRFVSKWSNPAGGVINPAGQKVAAFVMTADESMRLGPEETLAAELRSRGLDSVAGYTVLPRELAEDREKAKEFLARGGITAAVLMRVIGQEEETTYVPGTAWYTAAHYPTFWGYWDYGWSMAYTPGYLRTDKIVSIETLVYSIERDKLLWVGRSESTNPKNVRKFAEQLVKAVGNEMRKAGLVKR